MRSPENEEEEDEEAQATTTAGRGREPETEVEIDLNRRGERVDEEERRWLGKCGDGGGEVREEEEDEEEKMEGEEERAAMGKQRGWKIRRPSSALYRFLASPWNVVALFHGGVRATRDYLPTPVKETVYAASAAAYK